MDARALFLSGNVDGALAECDREIAERPSEAALHAERAGVRFYKGDREGAKADVERALALDASCAEAHLVRARLLQSESLPQAIQAASKVLDLDPDNAPAAYWRGLWKSAAGDVAGAKEDLSRAAGLPGDDARLCQYRGLARAALHDFELALREFDRASELGIALPGLFYARAQSKSCLKDHRGAALDLTRAIERGASAHLLAERGRERLLDGDRGGAIADFDEAVRLDPNSTVSYYLRGKARPASERVAAQQDFIRASATDPLDADGFFCRGLAKEEADRPMEAVPDFDRALELGAFYHPRREEFERKVRAGPKRRPRSVLDRDHRPRLTYLVAAVSIVVGVWDMLLSPHKFGLRDQGAVSREGVREGEYWLLLTAMFLHGNLIHLIWNMYGGVSWCVAVERTIGPFRFLACYFLSGLGASAVSVLGHDASSVGASGALFGMIGTVLAVYYVNLRGWHSFLGHPEVRSILIQIGIWTAIGVFALRMDNYAHLGGVVFGGIFGWLFVGAPRMTLPKRIVAWTLGMALFLGVLADACIPRAVDRAQRELRSSRLESALRIADEVVRDSPGDPRSYEVRGRILRRLGREDRAIQDFKQALDRATPGSYRWGKIYLELPGLDSKELDR